VIDAQVIQEQFQFQVHLLNDLQAVAAAVPHLKDADLFTLNAGEAVPGAALAVIAPGTGLGEAFLVWDGRRYLASPSEGGHRAFGPMTQEQLELLNYWMPRMGHVSYERFCSGIGIPNIYAYLRDSGRYPEPEWLREELSGAADQTPIIGRAAITNEAPICVATLEMFMEILGNEAANLALTVLATGGVYIGGGIPPRILPQLQKGPFIKYFCATGRFSSLMAKIPVHVIANPMTGLYGTAYSALRSAVIDNVMAHHMNTMGDTGR
jgi:glucokinase